MASQRDNDDKGTGEKEGLELVVADGLLMRPGIMQHWEKIKNFEARPEDIFIASYPKSGLMWTIQVMEMIKLQGDVEAYKVNKTLIPFLEYCLPNEEPGERLWVFVFH
uniref:Sulfotransferase n=1 Tax=Eptatretus burgeri TaxID=7764 RepID=A0A8C4X027_EPTBU